MGTDTASPASFYATSRGTVACRLLRERLFQFWPDLSRQSVLGLGFTGPYLRAWRGQASRCVAASPAQVAVARWPTVSHNLACTVDEASLPFADMSFDRILLVHGLEAAENARALLREAWRVLKDDGRMIVVAPNRVGLWAHLESTPFGHGQPYSSGQIDRLLASHLFHVERRAFALYMPPARLRLVLRTGRFWEETGRRYASHLGGVTITEAIKDSYAAIPLPQGTRRRRLRQAA